LPALSLFPEQIPDHDSSIPKLPHVHSNLSNNVLARSLVDAWDSIKERDVLKKRSYLFLNPLIKALDHFIQASNLPHILPQ
jgi:hypothetical protein